MEMINLNIKKYVEARCKGELLTYKELKSYSKLSIVDLAGDFERCLEESVFQVHTQEMVKALAEEIKLLKVNNIIEVCAGDGFLSKSLRTFKVKIKATDDLSWNKGYNKTIKHPKEVEPLNHIEACNKYKPDLVIICWEPYKAHYVHDMLETCKSVKYVIVIGEKPRGCTGDASQWQYLIKTLTEVSKYCIARTDVMQNRYHTEAYLMGKIS